MTTDPSLALSALRTEVKCSDGRARLRGCPVLGCEERKVGRRARGPAIARCRCCSSVHMQVYVLPRPFFAKVPKGSQSCRQLEAKASAGARADRRCCDDRTSPAVPPEEPDPPLCDVTPRARPNAPPRVGRACAQARSMGSTTRAPRPSQFHWRPNLPELASGALSAKIRRLWNSRAVGEGAQRPPPSQKQPHRVSD